MDEPKRRRRRGTGTGPRWLEASHRWQARYRGYDGKEHSVYARTEAAALKKLEQAIAAQPRAEKRRRPTLAFAGYSERSRMLVISEVIREARAEGWEDAELVAVLTAQLAGRRMMRGVFGPCVYCGTWEANEVEHRIPRARGGTDDAANLVSACHACNHEKNDLTGREYGAITYAELHGYLPPGFIEDPR